MGLVRAIPLRLRKGTTVFPPEGPTPGRKVVGFLLRLAVAIYHYLSRRVILNLQKKNARWGGFRTISAAE